MGFVGKLAKQLWRSSPYSLIQAIIRRWLRATARPKFYKVLGGPLTGAELCLTNLIEGSTHDMITGTFDSFFYEDKVIMQILPRALCWDIGSHFGYHSLAFSALGAQVVAFEPNPLNALRLKLNLDRNPFLAGRIRVRTEALTNQDNSIDFIQSDDLAGPSSGSHIEGAITPLAHSIYEGFQRVRITGARADSLIANGEQPPEVLKIDIEGAELLMLQGAQSLLRHTKPLLLLEVHHIRLMFHLRPFLESFGYHLRLANDPHEQASRCFVIAN